MPSKESALIVTGAVNLSCSPPRRRTFTEHGQLSEASGRCREGAEVIVIR